MSAAERLQPAVAAAEPLFSARDLTRLYGPDEGCQGVSFDLYPARCWASSASRARASPPC